MALKDKLDKVNTIITIERDTDNGWIFEASGRQNDEWKNVKILVNTSDTLYGLIQEHNEMEID